MEQPAAAAPETRRSVPLIHIGVIVATGMLLLIGAVGLFLWSSRPRLSETDIRDVATLTIRPAVS